MKACVRVFFLDFIFFLNRCKGQTEAAIAERFIFIFKMMAAYNFLIVKLSEG